MLSNLMYDAAVVSPTVFKAYEAFVVAHGGEKEASSIYIYTGVGLKMGTVYAFDVAPSIYSDYKAFTSAIQTTGVIAKGTTATPKTAPKVITNKQV